MKLQAGLYPNFYGDYQQIVQEKTKIFVGRETWLKLYWDRLCYFANEEWETTNKALLAHRKTGKTSFLRKLYNLAFTQQRQVIPFYYEFSNEKQHGKTVAKNILKNLICQATDFLLKEQQFSKDNNFDKCMQKLQELNTRWSISIIDRYKAYLEAEKIIPEERCNELLFCAWEFVNQIDGKFSMLIIDEAQEMAKSLFAIDRDGKEKIIPCHRSVASVHSNAAVWIIMSGSRVSELYYKMVGALANRISRQDFILLDREDSDKLVQTLTEYYGYSIYPQIYQDIWDITHGHPFYIQMIFHLGMDNYVDVKGKQKSFRNFAELQEVLYFEVAHRRGELYCFWENHFIENIGCLDDGGDEPGTTLQILFHIASNEEKSVSYKELEEKFQIKNVHTKIQQLMDADLIQIEGRSQVVDRLNDKLLSMFLATRYSAELFGTRSEEEIRKQLDKLMADIVGEKLSTITTTVEKLLPNTTIEENKEKKRLKKPARAKGSKNKKTKKSTTTKTIKQKTAKAKMKPKTINTHKKLKQQQNVNLLVRD